MRDARQIDHFARAGKCSDETTARCSIGPVSGEASKQLPICRGTGSSNPSPSSGESRANLTSWRRRNLPAAARASYQRLIELGRLSPRARAQISGRHRRLPARDALGRGTCRRARCQPNARCHRRRQRRGQYGSGHRAQSALRGRSAIMRSAAALFGDGLSHVWHSVIPGQRRGLRANS